LTFWLNILMAN